MHQLELEIQKREPMFSAGMVCGSTLKSALVIRPYIRRETIKRKSTLSVRCFREHLILYVAEPLDHPQSQASVARIWIATLNSSEHSMHPRALLTIRQTAGMPPF